MSVGTVPGGYTYHPVPYMNSQPLPGEGRGILRSAAETVGGVVDPAMGFLTPSPANLAKQRRAIGGGIEGASKLLGLTDDAAALQGRMAGAAIAKNPLLRAGLKYAGPAALALQAGDVILGEESLGNKAMDVGLMAAGGALGSFVPVVGTAMGAAGGKVLSDGIQFMFGDKKTPEQRKMELALSELRGGVI